MSPEIHLHGWMEIHRLIGEALKQNDVQMADKIGRTHKRTVFSTLGLAMQLVQSSEKTPYERYAKRIFVHLKMYYEKHVDVRGAFSGETLSSASTKLGSVIDFINDAEEAFREAPPGLQLKLREISNIVHGKQPI